MIPAFAAAVVVSLAIQALQQRADPEAAARFTTHPVLLWIADGGLGARLGALVLASVVAPLFEEAMFRGAFLAGTVRRLGRIAALLAMALIFALVHPQGIVAVPPLAALAVLFGLLRMWRGSLVAGIAAHAVHNRDRLTACRWPRSRPRGRATASPAASSWGRAPG